MNLIGGIASLVLAGVVLKVGATLLPSMEEVQRKGTIIPWILTWGMVWETVVLAVIVAGYLFISASKGRSKETHVAARS